MFCQNKIFIRIRVSVYIWQLKLQMEKKFKFTSSSCFKHVSVFDTRYVHVYTFIIKFMLEVYLSKENTVCIR